MESRNPIRMTAARIDCEIKHPVLGWVSFTANADDVEDMGRDIFAALESTDMPDYAPPVVDHAAELAQKRQTTRATRLQFMVALYHAGLLTKAEAAIAKADFTTQLAWREAADFRRTSPTITAIAAALILSDAAMDDLFRAAAMVET